MRRPLALRQGGGPGGGRARARGEGLPGRRKPVPLRCLEVSGAQVGWRSLEVTARRPQPSVPSADNLSPAWGTHKAEGGVSIFPLVLGGRLLLSHGDNSHVGKALGFSWTEGQMTLGQSRASFSSADGRRGEGSPGPAPKSPGEGSSQRGCRGGWPPGVAGR